MTISVGDAMPDITLYTMTGSGPESVTTGDLFGGKKVALFGLPGAFTPTCSAKHVPGFVANHDALTAKGIDSIVCVSVNDAFVMGAWGEDQQVGDKVMMVPMAVPNWPLQRVWNLIFQTAALVCGVVVFLWWSTTARLKASIWNQMAATKSPSLSICWLTCRSVTLVAKPEQIELICEGGFA